ncbi:MAG: hypothetical protein V1659_01115 [Candidatus Woesearchaeota archaeon]
MLRKYHRRLVISLMVILVLFVAMFFASFLDIKNGIEIVKFGMPGMAENYIVMVFSIIAMTKTVWELYKAEHPDNLKNKVRLQSR